MMPDVDRMKGLVEDAFDELKSACENGRDVNRSIASLALVHGPRLHAAQQVQPAMGDTAREHAQPD